MPQIMVSLEPECDIPVPGIFHFFGGIGTSIGTNWYRKKVSEPVSVKFGTDKKSRNRYRKNLVPEKSLGTGIGQIWYRKKVSEPASGTFGTVKSTGIGIENILGTVTHWGVAITKLPRSYISLISIKKKYF